MTFLSLWARRAKGVVNGETEKDGPGEGRKKRGRRIGISAGA
jgi:hypothetical protein